MDIATHPTPASRPGPRRDPVDILAGQRAILLDDLDSLVSRAHAGRGARHALHDHAGSVTDAPGPMRPALKLLQHLDIGRCGQTLGDASAFRPGPAARASDRSPRRVRRVCVPPISPPTARGLTRPVTAAVIPVSGSACLGGARHGNPFLRTVPLR